jgi:hypothetical protein
MGQVQQEFRGYRRPRKQRAERAKHMYAEEPDWREGEMEVAAGEALPPGDFGIDPELLEDQ